MAAEKIIITKAELNSLIMEEAKKFKKALSLKKELANINEQINEVHVGGAMEPGKEGVHAGQKKAVFVSKGNPNLKMEDGIEDVDGAEVPEMTEIERIAMDLGKAIEAKINGLKGLEGDATADAEVAGDEELEFDGKDLADEVGAADEEEEEETVVPQEEVKMEVAKPTEEVKMEVAAKPEDECMTEKVAEEGTVAENLEEPMEGKTPAQDAKQDTVNDNMEKSDLVKEGTEEPKATLLSEEKKRMAVLAGIMKG